MTGSGSAEKLVAPVVRADDGDWIVRSPGVGFWSGGPESDQLIGAGSALGKLTVLNRIYRLHVGAGAAGRVVIDGSRPRIQAVEFGQELCRLRALGDADAADAIAAQDQNSLTSGGRAVVAPTDGVFYRKPAPDAPVWVKVGDRIRHGQPIGLIEVMKTFNQIAYEAPDPEVEAEVVEIRAAESAEVRAGDVLLIVREV